MALLSSHNDNFDAYPHGKVSRKVTFSAAPRVSFVLQFSALFFFTPQSYARCYHPNASLVLYPEDREDASNPRLLSSNEFQFSVLTVCFRRFSSSTMKWNDRGTNVNPYQSRWFSEEKRRPRD
jgi:hypothetical protein